MDLLLDTNVLLPLAEEEDGALPQSIQDAMRDNANNLFVSTGSLWEMAIKHRLGKLPLPCPIDEWPTMLFILGVHLVEIRTIHVLTETDPLPDTRDPFDRLLIAICQVERMKLLTLDKLLLKHPVAWPIGVPLRLDP